MEFAENKLAYELAMDGHNVIITGQAGTGKSYLLSQLATTMKKNGLKIQKTASTGLAASLVAGEDGACTLHTYVELRLAATVTMS